MESIVVAFDGISKNYKKEPYESITSKIYKVQFLKALRRMNRRGDKEGVAIKLEIQG
jgi:hypothetical protein